MRLLIILWGICPCAALAQATPPPISVDDAVLIAVKNNPRLSAAILDVSAAQSGVKSARALIEPTVTFTPGITSLSGTGEEFLASQPLELNGTRAARAGIASAKLRQTQAQSVVELRDLVFAVKSAYYALARAQEQRALARDMLATAEEFDRITRRQIELGSRAGIDQTHTEIEVFRARQQVQLAEGQTVATLAALNTLLGREPATDVGALPPLAISSQPLDHDALVRQALAERAEITVLQAEGDEFRQEARLARAQGLPDLSPQLRIGSLIRGIPSASSGNGLGIGIAVNLPFFDHGTRRNRIKQAEESARAKGDRTESVRNQVRQEVEQALARLHAAEAAFKQYDLGLLEKTQRLLDAGRKGLEAGQTNIVTLLEAQRTFRAVQSERLDALVAYAHARSELERATGAVPPTLLNRAEAKERNRK